MDEGETFLIVSEFRAAFQSTCQVLEGRRPNDCMNNVGAEAVDPLFVEHDLGESSGSAVDVARRAGYPWPEQMARKMLRNVEISAISPAINSSISLCVYSVYNENRTDAEGFSGSGQDPLSTPRRDAGVGGSVGHHAPPTPGLRAVKIP